MENKHIIIILVIVIVVLAAAIGVMLLNQHEKQPSVVKITSDKKQTAGGKLSFTLTDVSENPISKEVINVTVTDKNGKVVVDDVVKTTTNGKAKLDLDLKKGKYTVYVSFGGNENFTGDNATQKLTIKEKESSSESQSSSSSSSSSSKTAYAYKSDGTPMYSQAEVDQYMYNKYGAVNYHIKSNGYVDMDEPGFDDKGNWVGY